MCVLKSLYVLAKIWKTKKLTVTLELNIYSIFNKMTNWRPHAVETNSTESSRATYESVLVTFDASMNFRFKNVVCHFSSIIFVVGFLVLFAQF